MLTNPALQAAAAIDGLKFVSESVSLGAAYAAGLAVGYWPDLEGLRANWRRAATWEPSMSEATRVRGRAEWDRAVQRTLGWAVEG